MHILISDECILSLLCFGRADRRVVYCLRCQRGYDVLSVHLKTACMKDNTAEERDAELKLAKKSQREWTRVGRRWEYQELSSMLPDEASRRSLVDHLKEKGFFVVGEPVEELQGAEQRLVMLMI